MPLGSGLWAASSERRRAAQRRRGVVLARAGARRWWAVAERYDVTCEVRPREDATTPHRRDRRSGEARRAGQRQPRIRRCRAWCLRVSMLACLPWEGELQKSTQHSTRSDLNLTDDSVFILLLGTSDRLHHFGSHANLIGWPNSQRNTHEQLFMRI